MLLLVTEEERSSGGLSLSVQLPLSTDDRSYRPLFMNSSRRVDLVGIAAPPPIPAFVASESDDGGRTVVELLYRLNRLSVGSFFAFGLSVMPATSPVCRDIRMSMAGDCGDAYVPRVVVGRSPASNSRSTVGVGDGC